MFRAAPLSWLALVFAYWMAMTVLSLVPLVGHRGRVGAGAGLLGGLHGGEPRRLAAASRSSWRCCSPVFASVCRRSWRWARLYLASLALVIGGSALVDDGVLARWLLTGREPAADDVREDSFLGALARGRGAVRAGDDAVLVRPGARRLARHGARRRRCSTASSRACMNWRAFLAYGAAVAVVMFLLPTVLLLVLVLASGGSLRLQPMALVLPLAVGAAADAVRKLLRELPRRVRRGARAGSQLGSL